MFYEVFQRLCSQKGKAESTVCRELGISSGSPASWRNGAEPRPSTKKALADYFDVPVSMFDEPFPEPPIQEPKYIPVHVITAEQDMILRMIERLTEKEKNAVIALIKELSK